MIPRSITFVDRKTADEGGTYPYHYKYMLHWYETATHYGVVYIPDCFGFDPDDADVEVEKIEVDLFPKTDIIRIREYG